MLYKETTKYHPDTILQSKPCKVANRGKMIVIGASTGGVDALSYIFSKLPANLPPIAVVQHIPASFGSSFIKRLDTLSNLTIYEVLSRTPMQNNCVYVAGGDKHMALSFEMGGYYAYPLEEQKRISRHKPSVDILFRSANNTSGPATMGIILTGMGDDGCIGIKELHSNGAYTIAENEEDCVVFGMPKKAIEAGGISEILSLDMIIARMIEFGQKSIAHMQKYAKNVATTLDDDTYNI